MKHPGFTAYYSFDGGDIHCGHFKTRKKAVKFIPKKAWDNPKYTVSVESDTGWYPVGYWQPKRPRRMLKPKRYTLKQVLKAAPARIKEVSNPFYKISKK